jgi:hypothetical protein
VGQGFDTWKKGGVRQAALEAEVPELLAPAHVRGFFVATKHRRILGISTFNPLTYFRREYVVVATDTGLSIIRLKRPPIFRSSLDSVERDLARGDSRVSWKGNKLLVDGVTYFPIPFHGEDAAAVACAVSAVPG